LKINENNLEQNGVTGSGLTFHMMSIVRPDPKQCIDYAFRNVYEISAYGSSGYLDEYGSVETNAALSIGNALTGDSLFADNRFRSASGTNLYSETEVSKSTVLSLETNVDYIVNLSAYVWVYWAPIGPSSIADVYGLAYADPVFSIDQALENDVSLGFSLPFDIHNHEYTDGSVLEPVPVPGSVWLLGSGLIALVSVRKKLKK
jgi:hypothetical protein